MGHIYLKRVDQPIYVSDANIGVIADAFDKYLKTKEDAMLKIGAEFIRVSEIRKFGNDEKTEKKEETYSKEDIKGFHNSIEKYLVDNKLTMKNEMQLLKDKGLIRCELKEGCPGTTITDFDWAIYQSSIIEYQNFMNLLDAWKDWRGKIEYAKKMDLKDLDNLAQSMKI